MAVALLNFTLPMLLPRTGTTTTVSISEKAADVCDEICVDYHRHCDDMKAGSWLTTEESWQIPAGRALSCDEEFYAKRCPKTCGICTQCDYVTVEEVDNFEEEFCDNVTDALEILESIADCVNELAPGSCESDEWHYFDSHCFRLDTTAISANVEIDCPLLFPGSTGTYIFDQEQIDFLAQLLLDEYSLPEARLAAKKDGIYYRNPDLKIIGTVRWNLSIPTAVGNCVNLRQDVGGFLIRPVDCGLPKEFFCQKDAIPAVVL